jgi:AraC-like DNA-binding protein
MLARAEHRTTDAPARTSHVAIVRAALEGRTPAVDVHDVSASWKRSAFEHHVDLESATPPHIATESEIRLSAEPLTDLLANAQEEVDRLYAIVRQVGYVVLLCDTKGIAIHHRGQESLADRFKYWGTWLGGVWAEDVEGTNGIGTCIAEQRPISVHRDQHFRSRHSRLSCAAAPILDASGQLVAVLDSSSIAPEMADQSHALALAATITAARAVEERLFRERYRNSWIIAAAQSDDGPAMLLAVDADRHIIGADRVARRVWNLDERRLEEGIQLSMVFEDALSLPARNNDNGRDQAARFRSVEDAEWHALITPPEGPSKRWGRSGEVPVHSRPRIGALASSPRTSAPEPTRGGLPPGLTRRIREYIESHLDETISLEALASTAGVSVHHFARAFKQTVGVPPHEYLLRKRVDRARRMLGQTDLSLSEIALSVGFSDHSHFARHFRRLTGMTPSAARWSQR